MLRKQNTKKNPTAALLLSSPTDLHVVWLLLHSQPQVLPTRKAVPVRQHLQQRTNPNTNSKVKNSQRQQCT